MRLVKLTLCGFKSFADRTEFTFDQPITGIVGPNGCGKSNVVDAVKWVLGERSSKSLRGTEMLDVIFSGSAGRKPEGMASVSLTFDNPLVAAGESKPTGDHVATVETAVEPSTDVAGEASTDAGAKPATGEPQGADEDAEPSAIDLSVRGRRALPIDADTVEIERRLFRDGGSAYLINGKKARLRDIRELFLDTGIGADAYSIIEQGKVDAMLLASPQERRTVFEEAAGVAKYKQRRIEAQRKLERTEVNLTAVREQLDSTERRLRIVRGQAVKARKFQELDAELKAWRMSLALEQHADLVSRLSGLTSRQTELGTQREQAHAQLGELEASKQELDLGRQSLEDEHRRVGQERLSAQHAREQATQRQTMTRRAIDEAQNRARIDEDRLKELEGKRISTEASVADQREQVAALIEKLGEEERRLRSAQDERQAAQNAYSTKVAELNAKRSAAQRIDRERLGLSSSIQADERRIEQFAEQAGRLGKRAGELEGERGHLEAQANQSRATSAAHGAKASELEAQIKALNARGDELTQDRRERARAVADREQELVRLDSRRAMLRELAEARAGFGRAVKTVLEAKDAGAGFAGVIAPLADLIETDESWGAEGAALIEAALGARLQALVVPSLAEMPSAEDLATIPGRVVFLPMRGLGTGAGTPATIDELAQRAGATTDSRLVRVRDLVRVRERGSEHEALVSGLLDRLLGTTMLVESLDAAMMLAATPGGGETRFVTRGGTVLESDGRVIAGSMAGDEAGAEAGGLLQRQAELEGLEKAVAALRARVEQERAALAAVDADAAEINRQIAAGQSALAVEQRAAASTGAAAERFEAEMKRLDRELRGVREESAQVAQRSATVAADLDKVRERVASLSRLHDEEAAAAAALEGGVREAQALAETANEAATKAKVEAGRLSEALSNARRELSRLELALDELSRSIRDVAAHLERASAQAAEHQRTLEACVGEIERAGKAETELAEQLEGLGVRVDEAIAAAEAVGEKVLSARQRAQAIERDWHSLEVAKRELEVKRENLEDRAREELAMDLAWEHAEYRALLDSGGVVPVDVERAESEIGKLRDAIKSLGSVNLDAIHEETDLSDQHVKLRAQVEDLDTARGQLLELIDRLNTLSRERFKDVFERIREAFGAENGMFRKLFGGGRAEVRLMPLVKEINGEKVVTDETDLLESGIEIVAKPPGKEPRTISQLSGGEKTLTAVALLMAIFRSKPSCFCVLDEVDAALDEGNVGRFNGVVREFTDRSHFIVITHNKRTMASADQLYGVTMQERGVSKRVSVRFEQVGRNGEIKADAKPETKPEPVQAEPATVVVAAPASGGTTTGGAMAEAPAGSLRAALARMREHQQTIEN